MYRILLLTMYFAPDSTSANAVIMTELAEKLQQLGHRVTVVTSFPHYANNSISPAYRGKLVQGERHRGMHVIRTYLYTGSDKQSLVGRLLNYATFNTLSTLVALFSGSHDVILAPSPPLTIGVSAWLLGLLKRTPYIYNVQDIYPDIAIKLGVLRDPRLIHFFQAMERFVYRRATAVSVLSEGFRQNLLAKQVPEDKIVIIPNFVDTEFVKPGCKNNKFAQEHGLIDKFVVLYAGNVGLSQGLEYFVEAAIDLQDLPQVQLLIVGNGAAKEGLLKQVAELGLQNVAFLPFQPRERLPEMYAAADLCLVSLRSDVGDESVPSKAFTILASGRPMVAVVHPDSETKHLIDAAACGRWSPPEDNVALAVVIRQLASDSGLCKQMGQNGRSYVEAHNTPKMIARQYVALFEKVLYST